MPKKKWPDKKVKLTNSSNTGVGFVTRSKLKKAVVIEESVQTKDKEAETNKSRKESGEIADH